MDKHETQSEIMSLREMSNLILHHQTVVSPRGSRVIYGLMCFAILLCFPSLSRVCTGILGFVFSYQMYVTYGAKKTGQAAWCMIEYGGCHLHHWLYCLLVLPIVFYFMRSCFVIGLCFGGIVHGIQFSDWCDFHVEKEFTCLIQEKIELDK
jgi:hypothetical protein